MDEQKEKIVRFDLYCPICKCYMHSEDEDPCDMCLGEPVNINSHKPLYFKEDSNAISRHKNR